MTRNVVRGVVAAVAALAVMAVVAVAGALLLGVDVVVPVAAALVALAVGGPAEISAGFGLSGRFAVVPSGVTLAGAVVLGWLLLRGDRDGLPVRSAAAVVAFPVGVAAVALAARGSVLLPGGAGGGLSGTTCGLPAAGRAGSFDTGELWFSVPVVPAVGGAVVSVLVVVGVCRLVARFETELRSLLWMVCGLGVFCVLGAWFLSGSAAAGGVLLLLPLLVFGAVALGSGLPWTVETGGVLACALDDVTVPSPGIWVAAAVLLGLGLAGGRLPVVWNGVVLGVVLGGLAWVSRMSVRLGAEVFGFSVPLLEASAAVNPSAAAALGSVAGLAGAALHRLGSVSSTRWKSRVR